VLGNRADHPHDPFAVDDLAFHADFLDGRSDFHDFLGRSSSEASSFQLPASSSEKPETSGW
jgi:hypothetical protein